MKKKIISRLMTICILALLAVSCSSDENTRTTHELEGTWNLISVSCECEPGNFPTGTHVWEFFVDEGILNVINTQNEPMQVLDSGNHTFTLNGANIVIDSNRQYDIEFQGETLYLSFHPESDGPLLELVKN